MPTIPPEGLYTEVERRFVETEPPGLWPENQDSNYGQLRKSLADIIQAKRDEIDMLAAERFVPTADRYLALWEEMLGAAIAPSGKSDDQRRAVLASRLKYGAFSRSQLHAIIQDFLGTTTTGGSAAIFGPSGIPILGGIPLYGAPGAVSTKYRIYEDILNYAYTVWIDSANLPDTIALSRELSRVTPAGITYTLDTSHTGTGLIDWGKTVAGLGPSGWWKLAADYNDYSGLAHHGTVTGAPTAITSPGLVLSAGADAARDFSGTTQFVTITETARLNASAFSIHAIVRPDALPTSGQRTIAVALNGSTLLAIENNAGVIYFEFIVSDGVTAYQVTGSLPVVGTTYRLVGVFDGLRSHLYIDGVEQGTPAFPPAPLNVTGTKYIGGYGGAQNWNGGLDEVMYFGYPLSAAQVLYLNNQAKNIL